MAKRLRTAVWAVVVFLFGILFFSSIGSCISSDKTYVFRVIKDGIKILPAGIELYNSPFSEYSNRNSGEYAAILSSGNKRLYSVNFSFDSLIMPIPSGECLDSEGRAICNISVQRQEYSDIIINFPYFSGADNVKVIHSNYLIFAYEFKNPFTFWDYWYYFAIGGVIAVLIVFWAFRRRMGQVSPPVQ